ncbi:hypothetical protein [Roseateles microcysteis]|uniref:hypothetical protein n=1 Tax=Roseateles microcysteis TaxID=3119057 RepID=UPI002FE65CDB
MTLLQHRPSLQLRAAGLMCLMVLTCSLASAQGTADKPLDFDDLARAGLNPSTTFRAQGVSTRVNELVDGFGRGHNVEREARSSSGNTSSPSSSSGSSSSTSAGKGSAPKTFVCTIYCNSASGPRIEREFKGPDRETVARMIDENADQICRGTGFSKASGSRFNPSQCRAR